MTDEPVDTKALLEALESGHNCLAFSSRDWGEEKRDAWLWGLLCGWDDALDEIVDRFGWDPETTARHKRLRSAIESAPALLDELEAHRAARRVPTPIPEDVKGAMQIAEALDELEALREVAEAAWVVRPKHDDDCGLSGPTGECSCSCGMPRLHKAFQALKKVTPWPRTS